MKKVAFGFIIGAIFATAGTTMAAPVIEKITASVRSDYSVQIDGKKAEMINAPLTYNGSSYLPVKEMAELLGKEVNFKDGVIKLDTPIADPSAELNRLKNNLDISKKNLEQIEKTFAEAELEGRELTNEQIAAGEGVKKASQEAIDLYQKKINELLERYPDLSTLEASK